MKSDIVLMKYFQVKQHWFPGLNFDLLESMIPCYPLTMKMMLLWCEDSINVISFITELNDWHNFSPFETDDIHYALENCFTLLDGPMETFIQDNISSINPTLLRSVKTENPPKNGLIK